MEHLNTVSKESGRAERLFKNNINSLSLQKEASGSTYRPKTAVISPKDKDKDRNYVDFVDNLKDEVQKADSA